MSYGVFYIDGLVVNEGDVFDLVMVGVNCFDFFDNIVSLVKWVQDVGDVSLEDGSIEVMICVGDGNLDVFIFNSMYIGMDNLVYIIIDDINIVFDIFVDGVIDFEGVDIGVCCVWGFVYSGNLIVVVGDNLDDGFVLFDECFDLSNNFVIINCNGLEGGIISLVDGSVSFIECMVGGSGIVLELVSIDVDLNLVYSYIVVDSEIDVIVVIFDGSSLEFDQFDLGIFIVYGVFYFEFLVVNVGDVFIGEGLVDVCFDLSDNMVEIVNCFVSVNEIIFEDGFIVVVICLDDGIVDILNFVIDYIGVDNLVYLIIDIDNIIIEILVGLSINFEDYDGDFVCVWVVVFSGNFLL